MGKDDILYENNQLFICPCDIFRKCVCVHFSVQFGAGNLKYKAMAK